jgi:trigger factor
MDFSLESTSLVGRRMRVEMPWDDIIQKENQQLNDLVKKARIPGFRPGKVPMQIIKQQFGSSVRYEVVEELIRKSFLDVVEKESIQLAGPPHFDAKPIKDGQPFEFTVTFEVYPEFELKELDGATISKTVVEITDADIDHVLHDLQKKQTNWVEVARAAKQGDRITIDFVGSIDGTEFPGGAATDHQVIIGSKSLIPGFEDQLINLTKSDSSVVNVTFPEGYQAADLAGKPAQFSVVVKNVEEPVLPAIDAEFAKLFGVEDGSIEGLRAEMKQGMERELSTVLSTELKQQLIEKLAELNPIEVPHGLVHDEIHHLKDERTEQFKRYYGVSKVPELPDDLFEKEAHQRVLNGLLFREVVKKYQLKADAARVRKIIEQRVSAFEQSDEMMKYIYSDENALANMENAALEEQVVEKLLEKAVIEDTPKAYFAVMKHEHAEDNH